MPQDLIDLDQLDLFDDSSVKLGPGGYSLFARVREFGRERGSKGPPDWIDRGGEGWRGDLENTVAELGGSEAI